MRAVTMMKEHNLKRYVGKRVRVLRKSKGMSQQALSEVSGVGTDYISNLENKGSNIKIDTLEKILLALDTSSSEFFESKIESSDNTLNFMLEELQELPESSQKQLLDAFILLIKAVRDKS